MVVKRMVVKLHGDETELWSNCMVVKLHGASWCNCLMLKGHGGETAWW
jgi:hypothetical protein